ncbi:MAG: hypothetical protein ACOH2V_01050 [Candidatus Saccharimonadaceae bacterium]
MATKNKLMATRRIVAVGVDLLVIEVPEDAHDFSNKVISNRIDYATGYNEVQILKSQTLSGYWDETLKILGLVNELTEKSCERFVKLTNTGLYISYLWADDKVKDMGIQPLLGTAKESFLSLLESNKIDTSKNLLLIERCGYAE